MTKATKSPGSLQPAPPSPPTRYSGARLRPRCPLSARAGWTGRKPPWSRASPGPTWWFTASTSWLRVRRSTSWQWRPTLPPAPPGWCGAPAPSSTTGWSPPSGTSPLLAGAAPGWRLAGVCPAVRGAGRWWGTMSAGVATSPVRPWWTPPATTSPSSVPGPPTQSGWPSSRWAWQAGPRSPSLCRLYPVSPPLHPATWRCWRPQTQRPMWAGTNQCWATDRYPPTGWVK